MMFGFEQKTSSIPSCMLYHYATSMNSLVTGIYSTRYIITRKDWCDFLYLLAGGRLGRVPRRPSRRLARAAPAMTSESLVRKSTWISQKPRLDAKHWKLSDGSGLQPD